MLLRLLSLGLCLSFLLFNSSCRVKRKEYIERHGLHSGKKPKEIAKEIGELTKKQKRAYKRELRKTQRGIRKRDRMRSKGTYYDK